VRLQWPGAGLPRVDKHSTGGIGDKVSLLLAPLLACCGVQVPMLSGRGLGATGGTLDKLESIPGLRTDLTLEQIQSVVAKVGCVICGATDALVPADRKLYGLRDVTATVPSIPLITASIMSKKLAEGIDALVLDVKFGSGAFMKTEPQARALAESLVATGRRMGVATCALLTDMNQPLGRLVGNAVEVDEAVAALQGEGPEDLLEVTLALGGELLVLAQGAATLAEGRQQLTDALDSGAAYEKLAQMVAAQGGDLEAPRAVAPASAVRAPRTGYVVAIDAERLGETVIALGGGRHKLGDRLDHSTGFEMQVQLGDRVERGQPLARLFAHSTLAEAGHAALQGAITLGEAPPQVGPLILDRLE
jgi:pyrimidine-nucleoside phosphorylase